VRPRIDFGNSVLYFGKKFFWGLVLCVGVIWTTVSTNEKDPGGGLLTGILVVIGGVIGILFAPAPKPVDHTPTASASVERMMDMAHELETVQGTITDLVADVGDVTVRFRLVAAQDVLLKQQERLQRSVSDWNEVSPGVAQAVKLRLEEGKRRFMELVERAQN
jgi:gas vesicle protein